MMLPEALNTVLGYIAASTLGIPCAGLAVLLAIFTVWGLMKCARNGCSLRDCNCCKRFLRAAGHDEFDDFALMVLVHEAIFERSKEMLTTVKVTAGAQSVETDEAKNGLFQQPLNIIVEQGTEAVVVDLLDRKANVLATISLDVVKTVLAQKNQGHADELVYNMKPKAKGIHQPKIKLTFAVELDTDVEQPLLSGASSDVNNLVRMQLAKARESEDYATNENPSNMSEMQVLKQACSGPLELYEGFGDIRTMYVSVVGPPSSKRWVLGIWADKRQYESNKPPAREVDLLRIKGVQTDPTRHHVFVINYYDRDRFPKSVSFRRIDRARDVWVEILRLLVEKVREERDEKKRQSRTLMSPMSDGSMDRSSSLP